MWLLSARTKNVMLQYFNGPGDVPGGYAILSHVWQEKEQSFQDIKGLESEDASIANGGARAKIRSWVLCATSRSRTRSTVDQRLCAKIRGCILIAREYGLDWVWIDTCCIDKTSSAELQEAINSMFLWYSEARVCFAYLADVPSAEGQQLDKRDSAFRRSRWFVRGWTLQELIAPRRLIFVSSEWTYLGSKASLASLLQDITGIDSEILTFLRRLDDASVARRMSWASRRQTTRIEDEAYSLLGLFGVTMPTIYGEGRHAFRRLQEEIMKHSSDRTLLAWGDYLEVPNDRSFYYFLREHTKASQSSLLAESPSHFRSSTDIVPLTLPQLVRSVSPFVEIPGSNFQDFYADIVTTGRGSRCHWPIIEGRSLSVALLPCANEAGHCIGLLLATPEPGSQVPLYAVGAGVYYQWAEPQPHEAFKFVSDSRRVVQIDSAFLRAFSFADTDSPTLQKFRPYLSTPLVKLSAHMKAIYIDSRPHPDHLRLSDSDDGLGPPRRCHIPAYVFQDLARYGFRLKTREPVPAIARAMTFSFKERWEYWHQSFKRFLAIPFVHELTDEAFVIAFGSCSMRSASTSPHKLGLLVDINIFPSKSRFNPHHSTSAYCAYLRSCIPDWWQKERSTWPVPDAEIPHWHSECLCMDGIKSTVEGGDARRRIQVVATAVEDHCILEFSLDGTVYNSFPTYDHESGRGTGKIPIQKASHRRLERHRRRDRMNTRCIVETELEAAAFSTPLTVAGLLDQYQSEYPVIQQPYSLTEYYWSNLSLRLQSTLLLPPLENAAFRIPVTRRSPRRSRSLGSRPHIFTTQRAPQYYMYGWE